MRSIFRRIGTMSAMLVVISMTPVCGLAEVGLSLDASIERSGKFSARIDIDHVDASCTVVVRGSSDPNDLANGTAITSFSAFSPVVSLERTLQRKAKGKGKKKSAKGYVAAFSVCSDGVEQSEVVELKLNKIKSSKKKISVDSWFKKLAAEFH